MKGLLSSFALLLIVNVTNAQTYDCEVVMSEGMQVKLKTTILINDSVISVKDIKSDKIVYYKIVSKSINNNSYKITDGVRELIVDVQYYEKPPMKIKGTAYHYWITMSIDKMQLTYFGEMNENKK